MITTRISKPENTQNLKVKTSQQERVRLRREFVEHIKKEVEASSYEIKSREIAEKVEQRLREDAAIPKIFLRSNEF